jgi:transposase
MAAEGRPRGQIAQDLCVTPRTVQRWLNAWIDRQQAGLEPGKAPGKLPLLAASLAQRIRQWVIDGPAACGMKFANWTHQTLARYVGKVLRIRVRRSAMGAFCRRHEIRLYRPTYRYLRGDPVKQEAALVDLAHLKKGPIRMSSCS